jgi:hypothetical protein
VIRPFHLNSDKIVHRLQPTPPQVPGVVSTLTANKVLGFRGGLRDGCVNLCSIGRIAEEEGAEDAGPLPRARCGPREGKSHRITLGGNQGKVLLVAKKGDAGKCGSALDKG